VTLRPRSRTASLDLDQLATEVVVRTVEIAQVPAPTGHEQERAAVVTHWWRDAGFAAVSSDDVGNCWAQARPGTGPAVVHPTPPTPAGHSPVVTITQLETPAPDMSLCQSLLRGR